MASSSQWFDATTASILDMISTFPDAARLSDESNKNGELPIYLALLLGRSNW